MVPNGGSSPNLVPTSPVRSAESGTSSSNAGTPSCNRGATLSDAGTTLFGAGTLIISLVPLSHSAGTQLVPRSFRWYHALDRPFNARPARHHHVARLHCCAFFALPTAVLLVLAPARPPTVPPCSAPLPPPPAALLTRTPNALSLKQAADCMNTSQPRPAPRPWARSLCLSPTPPPTRITLIPTHSMARGHQPPTSDTHPLAPSHPGDDSSPPRAHRPSTPPRWSYQLTGCALMLRHRPPYFNVLPKPDVVDLYGSTAYQYTPLFTISGALFALNAFRFAASKKKPPDSMCWSFVLSARSRLTPELFVPGICAWISLFALALFNQSYFAQAT
ncbi:hypothetical protein B0H16DRAFT_1891522, partial [Mycena metata]